MYDFEEKIKLALMVTFLGFVMCLVILFGGLIIGTIHDAFVCRAKTGFFACTTTENSQKKFQVELK